MILTHRDLDIGISEWKTVIKQMVAVTEPIRYGIPEQNLTIVDGHPNVSILLPIWSYHDCKMKDAVFK